jgi:hypothetical protein
MITPEGRAGLWKRLAALAAGIHDAETKAQYLADWRNRFDAQFPPAPPGLTDDDMLPDGRQSSVSALGERDAARLKSVAAAWLDRTIRWAPESCEKAGRWAWDVGRRVSAGLIDDADAEAALDAVAAKLRAQLAPATNVVFLGVETQVEAETAARRRRQAGRLPAVVRHWQVARGSTWRRCCST